MAVRGNVPGMKLTLGPLLFNWSPEEWSAFYARIAEEADVDRVVLGEVVCSKRLPFYEDAIPAAMERLSAAGKEVVLTSLALVTTERERRLCADLTAATDGLVEVADLTLMRFLPAGRAFTVSPLVNVYNEGTLAFLASHGARSVCLPPELPIASITTLCAAAKPLGVDIEAWAFGRIPLAISGRCYHARIHGLTKDSCQFVCGLDREGLQTDTLDGEPFLAVNGVQTLSFSCANAVLDLGTLRAAGVSSLRLSPQGEDMVATARVFRDCLDGRIDEIEALARLTALVPGIPFSNGFMTGKVGAERLRLPGAGT